MTLIPLLKLNLYKTLIISAANASPASETGILDWLPIPDKLPSPGTFFTGVLSNPQVLLAVAAIVIIGGVVGVLLGRARAKRTRLKRDVLHMPVNKLTPEDLGIEQYKDLEYYVSRESDEYLRSLLEGPRPKVLVLGKTAAGKTRTIYEVIKDMQGFIVISPRHHTINLAKLKTISSLSKKKVVLFLDDLDKYVKKLDIAMLISQLEQNVGDLVVLATCRTGDALAMVEETEPSFLMQFDKRTRIELRDLTPEETESLATGLDRGKASMQQDSTPGSIALDLYAMKGRYRDADNAQKAILRLLKILRCCFIFEYKENTLKKLFTMTTEGGPEDRGNWSKALMELLASAFITRREKHLHVYDAYLDDDVIDDFRPGDEDYKTVESLLIEEKDAEGLFSLGVFYGTKNRADKSIEALEKAIAFDPNHVNARLCLGTAYEKKDMMDEAVSQYEEVIKISPGNPQLHYRLGLAYYNQDMIEEAQEAFKMALGINPNDIETHYLLGLVHEKREEVEDAIIEYREALRLGPGHLNAHRNLAFIYNKKGMLEEAIREFKEVAWINPEDAEAHYVLASAYSEGGKIQEATAEYKELVRINPNDTKAQYNLAVNYFKMRKLDKAIEAFKEVLRISPDDIKTHYNLGLACYRKNMIDDAIGEYQAVLKLKPGYPAAYYNLALCYDKKGMTDEAIDGYKETLRNNPNHPDAHRNLALTYNKKSMFDAAIEEFKEAIRIRPNDPTTHGGLALAYHKKGMSMEARKEFRIYEQLKARLGKRRP